MRRSVEDLNRFYTTPEGMMARQMVSDKLIEAWDDVAGLDVLGLGYATPYLAPFAKARRVLAAMPAAQGAEIWPEDLRVRSVLVDEQALPFSGGLFDRILLIHALEEAQNPERLLLEASRLLSPNGRLIIAVAARGGFWAHAEKTPFGHGLPYSRMQLETAIRDAELEPLAWSYALYTPPWRALTRWSKTIEMIVPNVLPMNGGLILMEAGRRPFVALTQKTADKSILSDIREALGAKPVPTAREIEKA
ncbi:methyltransferase domain-containing protein [Asticcacaulis sp. ZE23SCel15]|uniref:class I SAM-dependent methyltransferase n=1 Tax=Asticcacaulis sp. ZE23SCel15 TaxID=3059027 RepID=UPI00265FFFD7|nr:methyltransferase domain-containing protein [Asticcacaulis sp. ZE23SCel15]WKL55971.1 methyltransferase domain-containing protein [Asticcacaulis sp. ZE23SCel15]